jgi:ADP-heptose:LPS heptosyltransferase
LAPTSILERLGPGDGVTVIRLRSLGDCVLVTPALRLLKAFRPDLRLAVVVEDRFREVFEGNPDIDAVLPPHARYLRAFHPALCLNLHGGTRSARLTLLSGATFRAGFDIFHPGWLYNVPIPTAQEILGIERSVHTVEHAASAMFYLGVPVTEIPRAFVPAAPDRSPLAPASAYAVVHPFAATAEKTWPARNFLELAHHIRQSLELDPVFIGGPADDLSAFAEYRTVPGAELAEISRLMRDAALFVGNDSGPAHIAAAFGIPVVALFGPSSLETWYPWRTPAEAIKVDAAISSVTIERVVAAIENLVVRAA